MAGAVRKEENDSEAQHHMSFSFLWQDQFILKRRLPWPAQMLPAYHMNRFVEQKRHLLSMLERQYWCLEERREIEDT